MAKSAKKRSRAVAEPLAVAEIQVVGFKSISEEQKIEFRPLTILAVRTVRESRASCSRCSC